jgi:hypothetical protein
MSRRNTIVSNLSAINMRAYSPLHLTGVAPVATSQLRSAYLNGVDQWMIADSPAAQTAINDGNFTLSMWVKPFGTGDRQVLIWSGVGASNLYWTIMPPPTNGTLGLQGSAGSTPPIPYEAWSFVGVTITGGTTARFFIDGAFVGGMSNSFACPTSFIYVGANPSGTQRFKGWMDEVAIFDAKLADAEMMTLYNGGTPMNLSVDDGDYARSTNLVAYWRLNDTFEDSSANSAPLVGYGGVEFADDVPSAA